MENRIKVSDEITTSGQPSEEEIKKLPQEGFKSVVNLCSSGEKDLPLSPEKEGNLVRELGMKYLNIPISIQEGIDEYSHLIILYWLDKVDKVKLKMRPQGRKDVTEVGIFASRCPWRPNPIGMTTVKMIERNGNIIKVKGLDVLDGTPLIDIKPFTPPYDAVEGMRYPDWVNKLEY